MKNLLLLLALALISCDDDKQPPQTADKDQASKAPNASPSSSDQATPPLASNRTREISSRSKLPLTGKWHAEDGGYVVSPYTDESLFAIGVISGSKMTDSEGNEFIVPPFSEGLTKYPIGKPIPDQPGFIENPFTGNRVDARGIPEKTLIRDPNDSDPDHKFRTPPAE